MDSNKIQELLDRYWNCETSLEEEQTLRDYFASDDVPEQFREAAGLFRYFAANKKKELNDISFNTKVIAGINGNRPGKMRSLLFNSMRIAAGISVLVVAVWFVHNEVKSPPDEIQDTFTDPRLAFEETKKALMIISKGFGTAEEQAKKLDMFNEAQREIQNKDEKF